MITLSNYAFVADLEAEQDDGFKELELDQYSMPVVHRVTTEPTPAWIDSNRRDVENEYVEAADETDKRAFLAWKQPGDSTHHLYADGELVAILNFITKEDDLV